MSAPATKPERIFLAVLSLAAWSGLCLQFYILVSNASVNGLTVPVTISRFFGYFTILTNLIVAFCSTVVLYGGGNLFRFFSKFPVKTAIAVYISAVGLGYNLLLRSLWKPQGLQLIADELLHDVVPLLYIVYWLIFVSKGSLQWRHLPAWLLYPFFYLICVLIRGSVDGFYPYPFLNVAQGGYTTVFQNVFFLFLAFIVIASLFIWLGKTKKER